MRSLAKNNVLGTLFRNQENDFYFYRDQCSVFTVFCFYFQKLPNHKSLLQITVTQRYEAPILSRGCQPRVLRNEDFGPHPGVGCLPVLHSLGKGIKIIWTIGCDPSLGYETTCRQHSRRATLLPFRDPGKLNFTCTWTSKRFKIAGISNFIRTCLRATQVQTCLGFCAIYRDPESSRVPWRVFVLSS